MSDKPWHDEEILVELYIGRNMDQQEIADRFGVNQTTISHWLNKHDIDTTAKRTKKLRDADWLKRQYWDEEKSTTEIADELGCSEFAVNDWMRQHGIERRTADHQKGYAPFSTDPNGYESWSTKVGEKHVTYRVHRLVAVAEHGVEAVKDQVVHHKNGVRWDNRPSNLETMSVEDHSRHHASE